MGTPVAWVRGMTPVHMGEIGRTYLKRWVGAATLDAATFEDVEADRGAIVQAGITVALAGAAAGLGLSSPDGHASILWFAGLALLAWLAWALVTFEIGVQLLPERATRADLGQVLRTLGFAATPGLCLAFAWWPRTRMVILAVTSIWLLLAMFAAVRHALDYSSTGRAIAVCLVGWALTIGMIGLEFFF